jgi:PAS domain S-box-containing protein
MAEQLDRRPAYLEAFVAASDDSMLGTDADGMILLCNAVAETAFGYPTAELVGSLCAC